MKRLISWFVGVVFLLAFFSISGALYTVGEAQQAVITQFGRPIGNVITQSGLHIKMPFVQHVHYFEKRLLEWDGRPNEIPTKDKKYIWVDTTARWRIKDALLFMQTVNDETGAQARLDDIIDAATRDQVTANILLETVRNSNDILASIRGSEIKQGTMQTAEVLAKIHIGRNEITRQILENASKLISQYGIQLIDVRIKRINYVEGVRKKVYDRMIAERKRAAEKYRSEGQGKKAEIAGLMLKKLKNITSEAYKKAEIIKGKADALAIKIYADAYNKDPNFYSFMKTLETYKNTVDRNTTLILSTKGEYYKFLKALIPVKAVK